MHNAVLALAAVCLVALAATPVAGEDGSESAIDHSALFEGTSYYGSQYESGELVRGDDKVSRRGPTYQVDVRKMGDPRLNGTHRIAFNEDHYDHQRDRVWSLAARIDNEEGSWLGTGHGYRATSPTVWRHQILYEGTGGYEGLSALVFATGQNGQYEYDGIIFPGEFPELPAHPDPAE